MEIAGSGDASSVYQDVSRVRMVRGEGSGRRLVNLDDGTAVMGTQPIERLSVLRVEPTPRALRDHGLYGQGMDARLAQRLEAALGVPRAS